MMSVGWQAGLKHIQKDGALSCASIMNEALTWPQIARLSFCLPSWDFSTAVAQPHLGSWPELFVNVLLASNWIVRNSLSKMVGYLPPRPILHALIWASKSSRSSSVHVPSCHAHV